MKDQKLISIKMMQLNQELSYHSKKYYEENTSEISDFEYDLLFHELKNLENKYPKLKLTDSITEKVGGGIKKNFLPFNHPTLMGSLSNAFSSEEVIDFLAKNKKNLNYSWKKMGGVSLSLKFDGLALELIYKKGELVVGATRGDGLVGENVTENIKRIEAIPHKIRWQRGMPELTIVRGEVVMNKTEFLKSNQALKSKGQELASNPRNLVAGMLRQIDTTAVSTTLNFFAYQLVNWEGYLTLDHKIASSERQLFFLQQVGFDCNQYTTTARGNLVKANNQSDDDVFDNLKNKVLDYLNKAERLRENLPYQIDGVVIKLDNSILYALLGEVGKRPRYAVAWKLPPEVKLTKLIRVEYGIGRTGKITPVGIVKPVVLGGAVVKRVTLHNANEIKTKDLRLGDKVKITRSGDVIPKILSSDISKRDGSEDMIEFPTNCPTCDTPLKYEDILTFCVNPFCAAKQYQNIIHFVSKEAMNIDGVGKEVVRELLDKNKIRDISDLYRLRGEDLDDFKRMGEKLKENILTSIEKSKRVYLDCFIFALGIPGVGKKMSKIIARRFPDINQILEQNESELREKLMEIDEVGEKTANEVAIFFKNEEIGQMIKNIVNSGVSFMVKSKAKNISIDSVLSSKKVHFTGTLSIPRSFAKEWAERMGAEIVSSVTSKLDYLVVGEKPGSKLKKANDLGIAILTENDFMKITSQENLLT